VYKLPPFEVALDNEIPFEDGADVVVTCNYNNYNYNNYDYGYNTQSYNTPQRTGGLGASYSATSHNVHVTTTSAPSSNGLFTV
jgi:hypothetical protein